MARAGYIVTTGAAVALSAATAKTVLFVAGSSTHGLQLTYYDVAFDGVTSTNVPVFIELNYNTQASNSTAGTGNTSATVNQKYGRAVTAASITAGYNCSAEPTVQTNIDTFLLTPNGGVVKWREALGTESDFSVSNGPALRLTAPAAVNARATFEVERI